MINNDPNQAKKGQKRDKMYPKVADTVPDAQNSLRWAKSVQWDQQKLGICRTAPATPGRLQIYRVSHKKHSFRKTPIISTKIKR